MRRWLLCSTLLWGCLPVDEAGEAGPDGAPADAALGDATAGADGGACPPPPADPDPDRLVYPGCRRDSFFVELPIGTAPAEEEELARIADLLEQAARAPENDGWWCPSNDAGCVTALNGDRLPDLRLEPLLPERAALHREDGHRRFFRLWFQTPAGDRMSVRAPALCRFVATLRDIAPERAAVGRECDVTAMGFEGAAPACHLTRTWHLARLGAPDGCPEGPDDAAGDGVEVALIDTGVDPGLAAALGVDPGGDLLPDQPDLHGHGAEMALLIRQIAPGARLTSHRVMDGQGVGVIGDVARAVDAAGFEGDPQSPRVINLSLGWPPALERARALIGPGCQTVEDPAGGAMRYVLDALGRQPRPPLVVAATGNQPRASDPATLPQRLAEQPPDACDPMVAPPGAPHFYPAEWGRRPSCRLVDGAPPRTNTLPVGGVDALDLRTAVSPPGIWSALVAPGEHVYVDDPAAPRAPAVNQCPGRSQACPGSTPFALSLPAALTGTSVAAALTSASAARLWTQRPDLPADTLGRLLYLSGAPICGADNRRPLSGRGLPVRRLHLGRAEALLACPAWAQIRECLESFDGGPLGGLDGVLAECVPALAACDSMAHSFSEGWAGNDCLRLATERPVWPATYQPALCHQAPADPGLEGGAIEGCGAGCPFAGALDRHSAGSAGPQPHIPTCPDCSLSLRAAAGAAGALDAFDLVLEINPKLSPDTAFDDPYLLLEVAGETRWLSLQSSTDLDAWKPGAAISVTDLAIPSGMTTVPADWKYAKAELTVLVRPPEGTVWTQDTSALRVTLP